MKPRRAVVAISDWTAISAPVLGVLEALATSGWNVVVIGSGSMAGVGWVRHVRQRGVAVLDGGVTSMEEIVAAVHIQLAVLADWQVAERQLTRLRQASPSTRAVVLAIPPQFLGRARRHFAPAASGTAVLDDDYGSTLLRELNVYAGVDGVLTGEKADADVLNHWLGGNSIAHAVGTFTPVPSSVVPLADRSGLVYASSEEGADDEAVEFLWREIRPRLDEMTSPSHPLYIVGVGAGRREERTATAMEGASLLAHVPSLAPYAERAVAWVLPLAGRAPDTHLLRALLAGTPVVATPAAVEDTPFRPGTHILVGDDPEAFAKAASRLLTDGALWNRLSRQGRRRAMQMVPQGDTPSGLLRALDTVLVAPRVARQAPHSGPALRRRAASKTSDGDGSTRLESGQCHSAPAPQPGPAGDSCGLQTATYSSLLATARGELGSEYVPIDNVAASEKPPVKLLAFYLPQFHPIPENDGWWGRGFTEWTNVSKAIPQFEGHYQPHLPGELGYYDLRVTEVQRRQVELARKYGIHGFCFHYYWFAGRRLLERPLDQFMSDSSIDFPFCVCWANENWTRRWDGQDSEVLIGQEHTKATDIAFIRDLAPTLRHRNYIRVSGRPMILVYRPTLLPKPVETADRWREYAAAVGLGEVYLVAAEVFEHIDPRRIGFDAAVEFPPNTPGERRELTKNVSLVNPAYSGTVYDYADLRRLTIGRPRPSYPLFRTVCPSWDNEPRRPGRGATYAFSSPREYQRWLDEACQATYAEADPERRLVFINAWNEWGEGAHLEPDRRFGYAYLAATRQVIRDLAAGRTAHQAGVDAAPAACDPATRQFVQEPPPQVISAPETSDAGRPGRTGEWTILFVSHDAARGGAQAVLLDIIAWLRRHTRIRMKVVCLRGGEWLSRFEEVAETIVLNKEDGTGLVAGPRVENCLAAFCARPDLIYANSVASGAAFDALQRLGSPILTHVHELEMSIRRYAADWIDDVLTQSDHVIACSPPVAENLTLRHQLGGDRVSVVPASIMSASSVPPTVDARARLRCRLGLPEHSRIVFGCGVGMAYRKGADLFVDVARRVRAAGNGALFYWIGELEGEPGQDGCWRPSTTGDADVATFLGLIDDPRAYLQTGDVFLLPSREDPFPLVALEAADCRLPIVCFDGAGGIPSLVGHDAGRVVPLEDTAAMASAVIELLDDDELRHILGCRARAKLQERYTTDVTTPRVLAISRAVARKQPAVSVIVPNYNHARFLPERLESIFRQTHRDFEVILLDDASTDESVGVLERYRDRAEVRIVCNDGNSGSTFRQWLKGVDLARGEFLWLAESDDINHPDFLATLVPLFDDPEVKLAYCASDVIDENGTVIGDYQSTPYLSSLSTTKWRTDYRVSAEQEINDGLGVKNTILSASAVLFRRFELSAGMRATLQDLTLTGDWYFAIQAIGGGDVHYVAQKLSRHRRHSESVIGKLLRQNRVANFFRDFYAVQRVIFDVYRLREDFEAKWEAYLQEQWAAFYPDRPFEDMLAYYPLHEARQQITARRDGVRAQAFTEAATKR